MSVKQGTNRYSDEELDFFKNHILQKLDKAKMDQGFILKQIENISDSKRNDGDWMDDTSSSSDLELLYTMVHRGRRHIQDLENALLRIHHKNYGICTVTGELIDKRRLLAVPSTSKCLVAKSKAFTNDKSRKEIKEPNLTKREKSKIITKIIRKPNLPSSSKPSLQEEDDNLLTEFDNIEADIDFNNLEME